MQFENICRREGLRRRSRSAAKKAYRECQRALKEFDAKIDRALLDARLTESSKRFLSDLWYGDPRGGPLSLGNRKIREASMVATIIVLLLHAQANPLARRGRTRFRMLTTTPELGIVDVDGPKTAVLAVGRHFDQSVRDAGVGALGFIDVAFVEDLQSPSPPKIVLHKHSVMLAEDNSFRVKAAEAAASPSTNPRNSFGLKVFKITSRKRDWGKRLGRGDVAKLGYYVSKISCGITRPQEHMGRVRYKTFLQGWTFRHALRQLQWYSYADVFATTRGVGSGVELRKKWKALLLRLLKVRGSARGLSIDHDKLRSSWQQVWADLRA